MTAEKYRCTRTFQIAQADDDGFLIENAPMIDVSEGEVFEMRRPGLDLDVWLTSKDAGWIDLDEKTFQECFERVSE